VTEQGPTPSRRLRGAAALEDTLVGELLDKRLVAVLATHEPDGAIHAVAVWYAHHEDTVLLATGSRSRKVDNLRLDARATLMLHDSRPGCEICGACLIGRAEVVSGPDAQPLVALVHRRYLAPGAKQLAPVREFFASDDVALRFRPERAFTWDERQHEAARALAGTDLAYRLEPTSPHGYGDTSGKLTTVPPSG
jgi:PPOX class probable F420-dependent enzyme